MRGCHLFRPLTTMISNKFLNNAVAGEDAPFDPIASAKVPLKVVSSYLDQGLDPTQLLKISSGYLYKHAWGLCLSSSIY